jgi:TadE-like protein
MLRCSRSPKRHGTTLVESALVYPVAFLLTLGLIVGAMGVYRYQEVSHVAREGARWASTHGAQYLRDGNAYPGAVGGTYLRTDPTPLPGVIWYQVDQNPSPGTWTGDIYNYGIKPNLIALDPTLVSCQVGWPQVTNTAGVVVQNSPDNYRGSKVFVTVSYQWFPEAFLIGPFNLTSTSSMPITN